MGSQGDWAPEEAGRGGGDGKRLALLLLAVASCSTATAPEPVGRVSVEVRETGTAPIAGARVTLGGTVPATALTDSGGSVRFDGLPLGRYGLTVARAVGFECGGSVGFELRRDGERRDWLFSCRRR